MHPLDIVHHPFNSSGTTHSSMKASQRTMRTWWKEGWGGGQPQTLHLADPLQHHAEATVPATGCSSQGRAWKEDTVNLFLPHRIPLKGDPNARFPVAWRRPVKMISELCSLGSSTPRSPLSSPFMGSSSQDHVWKCYSPALLSSLTLHRCVPSKSPSGQCLLLCC